MEKTITKNTLH